MIRIFVGYDPREAVAYHTFCQSAINQSSKPVHFTPLALNHLDDYIETHEDGSNEFIYSRFLVPSLCYYQGWALFVDGDMILCDDIHHLWSLRDDRYAVMVAKHDYKTKFSQKYLGNKNEDYPCKNWSSVVLWNCGHPANAMLTPKLVSESNGAYLHRFSWLPEDLVGSLPLEWNWLVKEYPYNPDAALLHYTIGTPCFKRFRDDHESEVWCEHFGAMLGGYEHDDH